MKASNKKTVADGSVNLVDLFFYLLSYWYWFVLGVLICGGYAAYKYAKSTLVYQANATVIIKDPSNQASGARLALVWTPITTSSTAPTSPTRSCSSRART